MTASYTPQEIQYFDKLFNIVDTEKVGILTGEISIPFLLKSSLPQRTLGEIWALSDPNNTGYLAKDGWWVCCRLIGWAQGQQQQQAGGGKGKEVSVKEEWVGRAGPIPRFEGIPLPTPTPSLSSSTSALSPQSTGQNRSQSLNPPLTPQDRAQFTRVFAGCGPENGLVSGAKAQGIFMKSGLGVGILAGIWNLADTQQRGSLDLPDFIIGMYYIQAIMSGQMTTPPTSLPAGLYEAASGGRGRAPPPPPPVPAAVAAPISRQTTGQGSPALGGGGMQRQLTGQQPVGVGAGYTGGILQPQGTGQSFSSNSLQQQQQPLRQMSVPPSAPPPTSFPTSFGGSPQQKQQQQSQIPWDVSPQDKQQSDGFFDGLDTARRGYLEGDMVVPFMMQSGLDSGILAQVWDLADIRKEGKLSKEEFAVAMHLINGKLGGKELPTTLPVGMTPPNLRGMNQEVAPEPAKDLFDFFGETPPISAPVQTPQQSYFSGSQATAPQAASRAMSPAAQSRQQPMSADPFGMSAFSVPGANKQPAGDLMGDDDDEDDEGPEEAISKVTAPTSTSASSRPTATAHDRSMDLGNAKNSLESTTKAVDALKIEREGLEEKDTTGSAELKEIEMRLSSVRAQHENENRIVTDLKTRVADQKTQLEKTRRELIQNESGLSALRAEKDEVEQAVLRDKEELRNMGKRMKEVTEETNKLKAVLETMKKEARQQKGMVAISKKQVSTLETGRDGVQKEMDQLAASRHDEPEEMVATPVSETASAPGSRTLATAQSIPLPTTPQRVLSPNPTGSKSNNPFERMGYGTKSPLSSGTPTSESEQHDKGVFDNLNSTQKTTLGVGSVLTAGALAVGGLAAGALTGAGTAVAAGFEALVGNSDEHSSSTAAPATTTETLEREGDVEAQPVTDKHIEAPAEDSDPFEMSTESKTPTAEQPKGKSADLFAAPSSDDPFGMPSFAQSETARGPNFDDAFGDDFGASSFGAPATSGKPKDLTEDLHLAPSSETAATGFDSEFDDFDKPAPAASVASAIPKSLNLASAPHMPERTLSTQALASESALHTPSSEVPSSSTPKAFEEERAAPVDVAALAPKEDLSRLPEPEEDESSEDEREGPEEADGAISPFAGGGSRSEQTASAVPQNMLAKQSRLDSPAFDDEEEERAFPAPVAQTAPQPSIPSSGSELFPSGVAPPAAGAISTFGIPSTGSGSTSPTASGFGGETRRAPPPPPVQPKSVSSTSNNPFASFEMPNTTSTPEPAYTPDLPSQQHAPSIAPPIQQAVPTNKSTAGGFDDDDFDFENLPSAQVAPRSGNLAAGAGTASASQGNGAGSNRNDFDDEFDDFSTDFEMVSNPSTANNNGNGGNNNNNRNVQSSSTGDVAGLGGALPPPPQTDLSSGKHYASEAPQIQGFDEMFGSGGGGLMGGQGQGQGQAQQQRPAATGASGFSFDDAFGEHTSHPPSNNHPTDSRSYAPPAGPPPSAHGGGFGSGSGGRLSAPALPQRMPSTPGISAAAQPDDLNDVKKLCNMGFDRELVIAALEANDYSFDKTLNALLPGA